VSLIEATDEFHESEHPRGQPGNAGQFSSSGGGGKPGTIEKGTGHGSEPQPDFKGNLSRVAKGDTTQPVKSIDELYEKAKKAESGFKSALESIANKYSSEAKFQQNGEGGTSLKTRSSAERKLKSELGGDVTLLRDVIRGTVVSDKIENTRRAAADFIAEHGDNILRVKDRYVDQIKGGYRDILINYRTPEGLVAEVQFNSKHMVNAKNNLCHAVYEQIRELVNPTMAVLEKLERQMQEIYDHAYLSDGDGDGWKHNAHDAALEGVVRRYKISNPEGNSFEAKIVSRGGVLTLESDGPIKDLSIADLVAPEQRLNDDGWEVERLEDTSNDKYETSATLPARDTSFKYRAIDRTRDIEYYTAESLGPNRERTPEGFLICYDVPAARIGEMLYGPNEVPPELGAGRDGAVRVTRSAAEVFDPRSMASINGKPITDDHPPADVDPRNWKMYTKGTVVNPRRGEGETADFLLVDLIVYDEETIRDIEAGKREVSCGYNPEYLQLLDRDTGEPIKGRGEQVKIRYNHLALVKAGRCGPFCAIGDRKTVDEALPVAKREEFFTPERAARVRRLLRRFKR
jgi:hypothetical protein